LALVFLPLVLGASPAVAQAIRHLYAAQPPAGSTFVRIVNPSDRAASVAVAGGSAVVISSGATIATAYVVVPGGKPLHIAVDGTDLPVAEVPTPDTFVTIVLERTNSGYAEHSIVDQIDRSIGLNAELIFYNLAAACQAKLALSDGPTVFDTVASGSARQRAVNPVAAALAGTCGGQATSPVSLPDLKAGDYYSLFLIGEASAPKLVGALDQTAPYQGREQ
jgi:hypothetical protein